MSLCDNKQFQLGKVHTDFIKENKEALFHIQQITPTMAVAAASTLINSQLQQQQQAQQNSSACFSTEGIRRSRFRFRRGSLVLRGEQQLISSELPAETIPNDDLRQEG